MAELLAVLGGLAAAFQLTQQCIQITRLIAGLYTNITDTPGNIRLHATQVGQLAAIAELIEKNSSLQTDLVTSILQTCQEVALQLLDELTKVSSSAKDGRVKKSWKTLVGLTKEEKIQALFNKLEQRKSTLSLCIETIDSALLQTLHSKLSRVETGLESLPDIIGNTSVIPNIDYKVTAIYDELVPAIRALHLNRQIAESKQAQESYFMLPFERDPKFIGREDILAEICEKFKTQRRVSLAGIGGVGKSQVVIEYCYRYRDQHPTPHVFWIYASTISRIYQAYKAMAMKMCLPGWDDPSIDIIQLVSTWLSDETHGPWLLVLDNADDMETFFNILPEPVSRHSERNMPLAYRLPHSATGSILITTRDRRVGERLTNRQKSVIILNMNESEAEQLFFSNYARECGDWDKIKVKELLTTLDYLPLAISQAAACISEKSITIDEYLEDFHKDDSEGQGLLSEDIPDLRRDYEIPNSVIRTWKISFDQIRKQMPRAAELLSLMAVLDRQGIPKSILRKDGERNTDFSTALGTLQDFSFVSAKTGGTNFEIHRLVQISTLRWLNICGETAKWQETGLSVLAQSFPSDLDEIDCWKTCEVLLPHAQAVMKYMFVSKEHRLKRADLLHRVSIYDYKQGRYSLAYEKGLDAFSVRDEILGPENPLTLTSMLNLAEFLYSQSKFELAKDRFEQHLEISRKVNGPEHPETIKSMEHLALIMFHHKGDFATAEKSFSQVLAIKKGILGSEHPETLKQMDNLGLMFHRQGKHAAALESHRTTFELRGKVLGFQHPDTLMSLDHLATSLSNEGEYKAAEEMCRRALDLQEANLGLEHPKTFAILASLALMLYKMKRYGESEQKFRQVLAIREKVLGHEHRDTVINMVQLGWALERQNKWEDAEFMYRKSLALQEQVIGIEHPDTLNCMRDLMVVLKKQEKAEAEIIAFRLLGLQEKVLGSTHEATMLTIRELGSRLDDRKDYPGAEKMYRKLLESRTKVYGPESPEVMRSMRQIMYVLNSQQKHHEAEELGHKLLSLQKDVLGPEHPDTIKSMSNLVFLLRAVGKSETAERIHNESLDLQQKLLDPEHPHSLVKLTESAQLLEKQKKYGEAVAMYQKALKMQKTVLSAEAPCVTAAIEALERLIGSNYPQIKDRNHRIIALCSSSPHETLTINIPRENEEGGVIPTEIYMFPHYSNIT